MDVELRPSPMSNTCAVPTVCTAPLCAMSMQRICIWATHQQRRDNRAGNIFYNLNDTTKVTNVVKLVSMLE